MEVVAALVAGGEAAELVEPGEAALDDPAPAAEPGAVAALAAGDAVADTAGAQQLAVLVVVVAAVGDHHARTLTGSPDANP